MKMVIKLDSLTHIIYVLASAILCLVFIFYSAEDWSQFKDIFCNKLPRLEKFKVADTFGGHMFVVESL